MKTHPPRRVIVLGAGAVGAGIGGLLFECGVPVVLIARGRHGDVLRERGLDLRTPGRLRTIAAPVAALGEVAPGPDDLVILSTMGQHTADAVENLDPAVTVASFQNGLLPLEVLSARGHATLAAMVWIPAERRAPGVVVLSGAPAPGAVLVGQWPSGGHPWADWLADRLSAAGLRAASEADIGPWIRAKLLTNLAGIVVALCDEPPHDVVEAAQEEARAVFTAAGEAVASIEALHARVGPLTAESVDGLPRIGGSTRHALSRGDSLETEALHAPIVARGRRLGVPTPVNSALIGLAELGEAEGWPPGALSARDLRRRVLGR